MAELYINDLKNDPSYKRLLELNKIIKEKYSLLIIGFKTAESYYNEAKEKNYPDSVIKDLGLKFQEKKIELYTKEEVVEYKNLERKISGKINEDFNRLKLSITNKFNTNNLIKL